MNKKNLKIPENVHVHENFRTWKSGKQWLYASSVLALIVAGGAIAAPSVKADQVLPGQQTWTNVKYLDTKWAIFS